MASLIGADGVLDVSGFMRPLRLVLDQPADCLRVTALPREAAIEFPVLPVDCADAREIDFGRAPHGLTAHHAPLPTLAVAMACTSDGATTFVVNEMRRPHALRVTIAAGAAPRAHAQLKALLHQSQRGQRRLQTVLRLLRSGLQPSYWIGDFAPLAGRLWRALPVSPRRRVCGYFADPADRGGLKPESDFGAVLAVAAPQRLALLLEVLASALEYWLDCARLEQIPSADWDRHGRHAPASPPTPGDFLATCHRLLRRHCAAGAVGGAAVHAHLTDIRSGGGMHLVAPAAVAFDEAHWNQLRKQADVRLEMSLPSLLEWSELLSRARRLTREQHLRLSDHVQEMGTETGHWTTGLANALIDEMRPAAARRAAGLRQSIVLLQQLQVAQLKLYLSGGLLRPLAQEQWRRRIRQHGELASIVACITAVHVDCAWDAMNAGRHYRALCRRLHALECGERDPVRQRVLCRDRELLEAILPIVTGEIGRRAPPHASDLVSCAGDAQRRLVLKIILIGLLDERLFATSDQWRSTLLRRLRREGARARPALNMNDMSLIAFLRHADAAQLRMRLAT